jgi:hypothetical protein
MQCHIGQDIPSLGKNGIKGSAQPIIIEGGGRDPQKKLGATMLSPLAYLIEWFRAAETVGDQGMDHLSDRHFKPFVRRAMLIHNSTDIHLLKQWIDQG